MALLFDMPFFYWISSDHCGGKMEHTLVAIFAVCCQFIWAGVKMCQSKKFKFWPQVQKLCLSFCRELLGWVKTSEIGVTLQIILNYCNFILAKTKTAQFNSLDRFHRHLLNDPQGRCNSDAKITNLHSSVVQNIKNIDSFQYWTKVPWELNAIFTSNYRAPTFFSIFATFDNRIKNKPL